MRDPDLTISTGRSYKHEGYGKVRVEEIEERVVSLRVERNDDRTTTAVEPVKKYYVHFQHRDLHIEGRATKEQKLENFQHAIHN